MDNVIINVTETPVICNLVITEAVQNMAAYAVSNHSHGTLSLVNLSGTSASSGLTLSAAAPVTAGGFALKGSGTFTQNTGTIAFANSNGLTFGLTGNQMTASHNGLTTAMASNAGSNFMGVVTAGTNVSLTANSSGLSLSIPDYLTTAQPVGAYLTTAMASNNTSLFQYTSGTSAITSLAARTGVTTATTSGVDLKGTMNSNGLNLGVPAWVTAATGGGGVGLNTAGTNITWTVNSSGISINNPAWLTTAMASNAGSNFMSTSERTNYLNTSATSYLESSLIQFVSNTSLITSLAAKTGVTTATTSGVDLKGTLNSNGLNLGVPAWITTATGGGGAGLNSAITGGSMTVNTSGISIDLPAYLTTAAQSNHSHGNPTLALTNLSGTTASASNGLTISLSVATGGGGGIGLNTAITGGSMTGNTSGLSINLPAYLTTAMQSASSSVFAKTGITTATTAGTALVGTLNTNGLSMGVPAWITTAMASQNTSLFQYTSATSAITSNAMHTSERTNYLNTSATSYLESSLLQFTSGMTKFAGILTTGITNGSATINSSQIQLNLPAPGIVGVAGSTNSTVTNGTVQFANSNGVSFGLSGSTMTGSVAAGSVYFSNIAGFSWSSSTNGISTTIYLVTA